MKNKSVKVLIALHVMLFSMSFQSTLVSEVVAACDAWVQAGDSCLTAVDNTVPLEARTPLILIHGWNPDGPSASPLTDRWQHFVNYFKQDASLQKAYKLYYFSYNSNSVSIVELGTAFRELLDDMSVSDPTHFGNKQISIIAHSMGGLVARVFLTLDEFKGTFAGKKGGERVDKLITLGTPHHGTPLANGPARDARAGPVDPTASPRSLCVGVLGFNYRCALEVIETFLLVPYDQLNRSELHWDNYDNLLDYQTYSGERNTILEPLNNNTDYDQKIIAYAGAISPNDEPYLSLYGLGATVLGGVFGLADDGIVPLASAQFDGHGVINGPSRYFFGYNHTEIATGKGDNDTLLFGRIRDDLLTSFRSCHLITPDTAVPQGWGAPFDVLSQERELFLKILCTSGGSSASSTNFYAVNTGTPARQFQITWAGNASTPAGYKWTGANWERITFSGGTPFKDSQGKEYPEWRVGAMLTTIPSSAIQSGTNYVVAYTCTWTGTQWKCGCHDSACAPNFWQLQAWKQ